MRGTAYYGSPLSLLNIGRRLLIQQWTLADQLIRQVLVPVLAEDTHVEQLALAGRFLAATFLGT